MADNVAITAGSGTSIATDDVSGAHYQKMKIYDGTADATNALVVSARGAAQVEGAIAHDSPVSTMYPILNGAKAANAEQTAVANDDVVRLVADLVGKLIVLPYANPENFISGYTAAITNTTRTAIIAAQGAGVKIYVTHILVMNSHASVGTQIDIEDGTSVIYRGYAAPGGGGFSVTLPTPIKGTANTALNITCVTTGANVFASASGYKGA